MVRTSLAMAAKQRLNILPCAEVGLGSSCAGPDSECMATKVDWPHPGIASGSAICIAAMLRCGPPCRLAVAPSIRELYFIVWCDEIEQRCAHRFSRVTDYADFCHSRPAPAPVLMRLPTAGRVMKEEPTGASTYDQMK